jgi:hypothetical protein
MCCVVLEKLPVTILYHCYCISGNTDKKILQTHATSYSFYSALVYTVKQKGGKPHPLPYSLRNPYRNLKSENSQDYAQKPQRNCMFMNSASGEI